jgi:flagellar hook-basal body complex protein FliE
MEFLSAAQATGDTIRLSRTSSKHLPGVTERAAGSTGESGNFGEILGNALAEVNSLQQESTELFRTMITEPDSVDAHDVTIAMSKANLALSITKAVVDRALRAYNEIINVR